tara:strand:+ start:163 stop:1125 length:963 start_codon:yes stop_codon:yes gene_type:complete
MAVPKVGRGGAVLAGQESTWGTPVSRTVEMPVLSMEMSEQVMREPRLELYQGAITKNGTADKGQRVSGKAAFAPTYENFGMWLKNIMGSLATTGPSATEYTHTHSLASLDGLGLTLEAIRGNSTNSIIYEGCKVSSASFKCSAALGYLRCDVNLIGETSDSNSPSSAATVSLGAGHSLILAHQMGNLSLNGNNYNPVEFTLNIERGLDSGVQLLGSKFIREPTSGWVRVTLDVVVEHQNDVPITEYIADTSSADVTFGFAGSGDNDLDFTLNNQKIMSVTEPVDGPNAIRQRVKLEGFNDGTDLGLVIVNKNANSSGVAN